MSAHMIFEVAFGDKLLPTDFALVISMSVVTLEVHVQVALLCEFVTTKVAVVGFYAQMLADVYLQPRFLRVTHFANYALKGLHVLVVELMGLQVSFSNKTHIAARIFTLERSLKEKSLFIFNTKIITFSPVLMESL